MNFLEREESDLKGIFNRFKKRDFKGTEGQAIKNSSFQLATTLIAKAGSLIFTIIIARMLLPELFGLYTLALSTIILFASFSDFGLGSALVNFISKSLVEKSFPKAKTYFIKLLKYKLILVILASLVLLSLAYYVSNVYYNKPIFYALLAGGIYLPVVSLLGFIETAFKANNNFREPFFKEFLFQVLRLIFVPLAIFLFLKGTFSNEAIIAGVIIILAFSYFLTLIFLVIMSKYNLGFLKVKKDRLTNVENKSLKKFILPLTATALSGVFFGYIDTIMLGHFVTGEFIGYYGSTFSLIGAGSVIIGFAGAALFPIFSRLKGQKLEKAFKKTFNFILIISLVSAILSFFLAPIIINIVYGQEYSSSIILLRIFSLLLIVLPLTGIYDSYFMSQERTKIIAILLVGTTIVNIVLNYVFIVFGLKFGMMQAVIGACIATIISRYIYFFGMKFCRQRSQFKEKNNGLKL